jgi:MscS family membrane protein
MRIVIMIIAFTTPLYAEESLVHSLVRELPQWWKTAVIYLEVWQWALIGISIVAGLVVKKLMSLLLRGIYKITSSRNNLTWDDMLVDAFRGPTGTLAAVGLWYITLLLIKIPKATSSIVMTILQIIASIALVILAYRLTNVLILFLKDFTDKTENDLDDQLMPVVEKTLRVLVVVFGAMISLQNLGVNVMSALAGLGLGGLAFALAAKDTAANIFGSITILLDKPFRLGDWINIGEKYEGVVEDIGLRTTRIRTFAKTLIAVPNSVVAVSSIENFSRRPYRRIVANLGVTYDTTAEKIEVFIEEIKKIVVDNSFTVEEGLQVSFTRYDASSLNILVYFFVEVSHWGEELKAKQEINLAIKRKAQELGIDFAFPSQSVYIESMPEK